MMHNPQPSIALTPRQVFTPAVQAAVSGEHAGHSQLFESFANAPADWRDLCGSDDLAMDTRVLSVYQRTLADQCRCWGLIVYDASGAAVACAALCLFQTDIIQPSTPAMVHGCERMRRIWPGFGRMNILFCGLSIPAGSMHIRMKDGADKNMVFTEINAAMQQLAKRMKCRMMIFKELEASAPLASALAAKGFIKSALPLLHVMHVSFKSFANYRDALKSRYRSQIMRSEKKLAAAGFEVINGRGPAFFTEHLGQQAYSLYLAVLKRAEHRLERMPLSFFHEMARELGDEALLTVIRRDGKVCAFTFSLMRGTVHYNTYSGLDYALNNEGDLYFNLFYQAMDQALRAGATSLYLGQSSDAFKSRLGTVTEPLSFFIRARPLALHAVMRVATPWISPKIAPVEAHDVFAELP